MSRRRKEQHRRPEWAPESETGPASAPPRLVPDPPRPNRGLLVFAILLTVLWVGALVVMAVFT